METPTRSPSRKAMSLGGQDTSDLLGSPSSAATGSSASGSAPPVSNDLTLFSESAAFEGPARAATLLKMKRELLRASRELSSRSLYAASKWAVEQVLGMADDNDDEQGEAEEEAREGGTGDEEERARERREEARLLLAKNHFDLKDFNKAAHVLEPRSALDDADVLQLSRR